VKRGRILNKVENMKLKRNLQRRLRLRWKNSRAGKMLHTGKNNVGRNK
jgi:hypothetical protein